MWKRHAKSPNQSTMSPLLVMFFVPTLLALLAPIIHRASLLLNISCFGESTSEVIRIQANDFWPVLLAWIPALLCIPFILGVFSDNISAKLVCTIFVCSCLSWVVVSMLTSWLLHAFVVPNLSHEYVGLFHAVLNNAVICAVVVVASLGWFEKSAYDFIAGFALFGTYTGFMFFFSVETYFGTRKLYDVPLSMGRATLFIVYSIASSSCFAIIVSRVRMTISSYWLYIWGFLWSMSLSIGVSLCLEYPMAGFEAWISVVAVRYACFALIGILGIGMSYLVARPVMQIKDQIRGDSNMQYALSLMTRNEKASSSLMSSPTLVPVQLL